MRAHSIVIAVLILLASCVPPPRAPADATAAEEKGFAIFMREGCFSSCHVATIASDRRENLSGAVPDLRKTQRRARDWYLAYFVNPRALLPFSTMPPYGYFSEEEFQSLVAFLRHLNRDAPTPPAKLTLEESLPNVLRDLAAYKAGQAHYRTYCVGCHGESGDGAGPVGHLLSPEPRDFTDALWMSKQSESYLYSIISNGKPNTAMPAFKEILNPTERAALVRYLGYFTDPVAKERLELGFMAKETNN